MPVSVSRRWLVGAALLLGATGLWFATRGPPSDEDQIRAAIEQVAEGARTADLARTMEPISPRYRDAENEGTGYDELKGLIFLQYQRRGPISVLLGPIQVQVDGDRARAVVDATLADFEEGGGGLLPRDAELMRFTVDFEREEGEWRVVTHTRASFRGP